MKKEKSLINKFFDLFGFNNESGVIQFEQEIEMKKVTKKSVKKPAKKAAKKVTKKATTAKW